MLRGVSKFTIVKTTSRGKAYDKCLVNIPVSLFKAGDFPFKSGDSVEILIEPELKTIFLTQKPELWQQLIKTSKEIAKTYDELLKSLDSDPSITPLQRKIAKLYFENIVEEQLPKFLSKMTKEVVQKVLKERKK